MIPYLTTLEQVPAALRGGAVAVGNFDGIHRGHAQLVHQLVRLSQATRGGALVITFDPPPIAVLQPQRPVQPPLTTLHRRAELLGDLGVAGLLALPTSPKLLDLSPAEFFNEVLVGALDIQAMVEGPNFRFGKDRAGDVQMLGQLCQSKSIQFQVAECIDDGGGMISSSRIRQLLAAGEIANANQMLIRPYQISGLVGKGAGRGAGLGIPTANLCQIRSLLPGHGVYAARVQLNGRAYRAAINIGPNPTFAEMSDKVEVHVLDWHGDLYGAIIACDLIDRVREVRRFEGAPQLLQQIQDDLVEVARMVEIP